MTGSSTAEREFRVGPVHGRLVQHPARPPAGGPPRAPGPDRGERPGRAQRGEQRRRAGGEPLRQAVGRRPRRVGLGERDPRGGLGLDDGGGPPVDAARCAGRGPRPSSPGQLGTSAAMSGAAATTATRVEISFSARSQNHS